MSRLKILIVDDSPLDRIRLKLLVGELNEVIEAENVDKAIEVLAHSKVDLVISDLMMPGRSGMDIVNYISEQNLHLPIILITASSKDKEFVLKAYDKGAVDFISKKESNNLIRSRIGVFLRICQYEKTILTMNTELKKEKNKSDELLENILPQKTIKRLKLFGNAKPRKYNLATVLFTDFVAFTETSQMLSPEQLVGELAYYFNIFDDILESFSIEKIKTIGDSYMCVGGIPIRNRSNPIDMVLVALRMREAVLETLASKTDQKYPRWSMRIGIHTGSLVAGIIGSKKFAFDVWGETVNIANRIESSADPNTIFVSEETNNHLKGFVDTSYVGKIYLKGIGDQEIYSVNRIEPKYSKDEKGIYHNQLLNEDFYIKFYNDRKRTITK